MTLSPHAPRGVRIAGTGMAVPPKKLHNDDLAKFVDTSDEWIRPRTGIVTRHLTEEDERTADLAAQAVTAALEDAGMAPGDLDLLILATMTQDMICPATACQVVAQIGSVPCGAMDLNMACTGFVGGLNIAASMIATGFYKNIVVVGADRLSSIVNWEDRRTCVLFGDAAGAAIVSASDNAAQGCLYQSLNSDAGPGQGDALYVPRTAADIPDFIDQSNTDQAGWNGKFDTLQMNGAAVFKFAVNALRRGVEDGLERTGLTADDITMIIPHQSNKRIMDAAWRKLGFGEDKYHVNIDRFGNTSAASVGLGLAELRAQGKVKEGDKVIFVAQGGGLTWGTSLWQL